MSDDRNIQDRYKSWMDDLIREDLKKKSFPYAVLMSQIHGDYNFGSVVRSANAFGAEKVFYYGKKHWDKRSSVGTHHYFDVKFLENFEHILALKQEYKFVGLENTQGACKLSSFSWPKEKCLILIGEESQGLTPDILQLCDFVVEITMVGSVRSLNASVAGAVAMNDLITKNFLI